MIWLSREEENLRAETGNVPAGCRRKESYTEPPDYNSPLLPPILKRGHIFRSEKSENYQGLPPTALWGDCPRGGGGHTSPPQAFARGRRLSLVLHDVGWCNDRGGSTHRPRVGWVG